MTSPGRLAGRIALVTGASRGIGAAVAKLFAAEGAHIVALARTVGGLEDLDDAIKKVGGTATLVPQDLGEFAAVDKLGAALYQRYGRLDILVGNAGVLGGLTPVNHIEPKSWDEALAINLTANYRLIRSLDPLLRQSDAGRAIFVTTGATRRPRPYWGTYGASKIALEYLVLTWAAEVAKTDVRINLINPGATRTAMRAAAMPGEDPQTLPMPDEIAPAFVNLASPDCMRHGEIINAQ